MLKWLFKRKKCITEIERYVNLIFYMLTDIKDVEYLKKIYEFTEVMWKKEKRDGTGNSSVTE